MNKYLEKMKDKPWLNEYHLLKLFQEVFGKENVEHNKQFLSYKFRPDILIESIKLIVEFDGYRHYTDASICLKDLEKDKIFKDEGYNVCRVPYFVQIRDLFLPVELESTNELYAKLENASKDKPYYDYLSGFIDDKVVLPANFCSLGIKKFKKDLVKHSIFDKFTDRVTLSLIDKCIQKESVLQVLSYPEDDNEILYLAENRQLKYFTYIVEGATHYGTYNFTNIYNYERNLL